MDGVIMVFTQNELIIMIGVVSILLICITILTILDIKEYLRAKRGLIVEEETDFGPAYQEEEEEVSPVKIVEKEEKPEVVTVYKEEKPDEILITKEVKPEVKKEEIYLEEMDDEKFDVKKEVKPIIQEIKEDVKGIKEEVQQKVEETKEIKEAVVQKVEEVKEEVIAPSIEKKEKKRLDVIEELTELEDKLPNKKDDVTNFEMEQERTAIISLDELMQKSEELYNDNEYVQYDDGNEPITIDEVINRFNREKEKVAEKLEEVEEVPTIVQEVVEQKIEEKKEERKVEPYSRKETIPFISSVYGIEKDNALEFENTATYEKLDRAHYNDFAQKLREMNENK